MIRKIGAVIVAGALILSMAVPAVLASGPSEVRREVSAEAREARLNALREAGFEFELEFDFEGRRGMRCADGVEFDREAFEARLGALREAGFDLEGRRGMRCADSVEFDREAFEARLGALREAGFEFGGRRGMRCADGEVLERGSRGFRGFREAR